MWTKVVSNGGKGRRPKRATFGVRRSRTGLRNAILVIPGGQTSAERATVYSDGNGKIAFALGDKGDLKVRGKGTRLVAIPMQLAHLIPFGTRDATVTNEGGMLVLDTKQFTP